MIEEKSKYKEWGIFSTNGLNISVNTNIICFDFGWYSGNPFYLFQINLFEVFEEFIYKKNKLVGIGVFHIQICKFIVALNFYFNQ